MFGAFLHGIRGPLLLLGLFVVAVLVVKYIKYQWDKAGGV